jgi:hypothetical protein
LPFSLVGLSPVATRLRAGHRIDGSLQLLGLLHQPPGSRQHLLSHRRGTHSVARAFEQFCPERLLDALERFCQRRLAQADRLRGPPEMAELLDAQQMTQFTNLKHARLGDKRQLSFNSICESMFTLK